MPSLFRIFEVVLYSLLNFLPFVVLALYPFRRKLRYPTPITAVLVGVVTFAQIGLGVWAALFGNGNSAIISAVSTLVYLSFYFTAVKAHPGKTLFTLLMLSNIANFVVIFSKCLEGIFFPDMALQSYRWTFSVMMIGVELFTLIPLFCYIRRTYSAVFDLDTAKPTWRFLWLIPATFYVVWYYHLYNNEMSSLEIALEPANTAFMLVINLGALLIYHMVIQHIRVINDNLELIELNHQLTMKELQYDNLQERITEARQAKHDIRHHISMMRDLLQKGEYDKLKKYLDSYQKTVPDDSTFVYCENRAVNILLMFFAQQAKNNDIDFVVSAAVPEQIGIAAADLSVLLGNLLENAIDACTAVPAEKRRILIKARTDSASLFFAIDNSYNGIVRRDKHGNYLTTKKKGSGLGISSAQNIVKQYDGRMSIQEKDEWFCVSVMLNH